MTRRQLLLVVFLAYGCVAALATAALPKEGKANMRIQADDSTDDYDDYDDDDYNGPFSKRALHYFKIYLCVFGGISLSMWLFDYLGIGGKWITTISDEADKRCVLETQSKINSEEDALKKKEMRKDFSIQKQVSKRRNSVEGKQERKCFLWDKKVRLGGWVKDDDEYSDYFKGCLLQGRRWYGVQSKHWAADHPYVAWIISYFEFSTEETGSRITDLLFYFCNNQDIMSMGFASPAHPYSRAEKQRSFFILQGLAFTFTFFLTFIRQEFTTEAEFKFWQIALGTVVITILQKFMYYISALPCLQGKNVTLRICKSNAREVPEDKIRVITLDLSSVTDSTDQEEIVPIVKSDNLTVGDEVEVNRYGEWRPGKISKVKVSNSSKLFDVTYGGFDLCIGLKSCLNTIAIAISAILILSIVILFFFLAWISLFAPPKNLKFNALGVLVNFVREVFVVKYCLDFVYLFQDYIGITLILRINLGCYSVTLLQCGVYYEEKAKYKHLKRLITDEVAIEKLYHFGTIYGLFQLGLLRSMEDFDILEKIESSMKKEKMDDPSTTEDDEPQGLLAEYFPCVCKEVSKSQKEYDKKSLPEKSYYWTELIDSKKPKNSDVSAGSVALDMGGIEANKMEIGSIELQKVQMGGFEPLNDGIKTSQGRKEEQQ